MRVPSQGRVYSDDFQVSRGQDLSGSNIQKAMNTVPVRDTRIIEATIGTSDTLINHGLNRIPEGYIVIGLSAAETVYTSPTVLDAPQNQIILLASGTVTARLMFF